MTHLEVISDNVNIYFGVLKVEADITVQDHKVIRQRFLKGLATLAESRNANIKVYVTSELDEHRCHYHYAMTSTTPVVQHAIKTIWDEACACWPTIVDHDPPRSIVGASKYMFKDMLKPGFIRIFRRKTLRITWGNIGRSGFFPMPKDHYWRQFNEKIKRTSNEELRLCTEQWDTYV